MLVITEFISKPFQREVIINRVKNALRMILARKTEEKILATLMHALDMEVESISDMDFEELFKFSDIISNMIDLKLSKLKLKNNTNGNFNEEH